MAGKSPTGDWRRPGKVQSKNRQHLVGGKAHNPSGATLSGEAGLPHLIGSIFRSAREIQHLSQDQVADLTAGQSGGSVSRAMISAIELGRTVPGVGALLSLTEALNLEAVDVLERIKVAKQVPMDLTGLSLDDLRRRGEEFFWSGDFRSALAVYDAMFQRLVLDPPKDEAEHRRLAARIEINRSVSLRRLSALRVAHAAAERAIEFSEGMSELQAEAYMVLASLLSHEGFLVLARDAAERAIRLSRNAGPKIQGEALSQNGNLLYRFGKFEEARKAFLEAYSFARRARDYHELVKLEGNIGACLFELGRLALARKRFIKAVELARKYSDPAMEASWLVELGHTLVAEDRHEEAARYAEAALRIAKPKEHYLTTFRAEWLLHCIVRRRTPEDPDRHRLAYLRKLYPRVKEHKTVPAILEFKRDVLDRAGDQDREPG